jgi:hypothetical protein
MCRCRHGTRHLSLAQSASLRETPDGETTSEPDENLRCAHALETKPSQLRPYGHDTITALGLEGVLGVLAEYWEHTLRQAICICIGKGRGEHLEAGTFGIR